MKEAYELVRALLRLGGNATEAALAKIGKLLRGYLMFLSRVSAAFGVSLVFVLILFALGAATGSKPVISVAVFLGGIAVFLWLLAAFPIVLAVQKGFEWDLIKNSFEAIGVIALWIFFLSIYFYIVKVPLVAIPLVVVLAAAMALASVLFGVGISARFLSLRLGLVFTAMTIFFFMSAAFPTSMGGLGRLVAWADKKAIQTIEGIAQPLPQMVVFREDLPFFDARSQGEPKPIVWYHRSENGYELFDAEGSHPIYGKKLEPVTPDNVTEIRRFFREKAEKAEVEIKKIEEERVEKQRLDALEQAVKDAQTKAAQAVQTARIPGPQGRQGKDGEKGTPGETKVIVERVEVPIEIPTSELSKPQDSISDHIVIPEGTPFEVVLDKPLSTEKNRTGEPFWASLEKAVWAGNTQIPVGTAFTGRITDLQRPGRVSGVAVLVLALERVEFEGSSAELETEAITIKGEETKAEDVGKIALGTGLGALFGRIIGGNKGAAEGAAIGGGSAVATVAATRGKEIELKPETKLIFRLVRDATFK